MGSFGGEVGAKKRAMWLYPKVLGINPPERWGHSACYSNGFLYIFGGCCGGLHFSNVLVLNLDTMVWNNLVTTGQGPGPRDSHSAVLVENKMIVFGGTNGSKKVNDIHILDLRSIEWSQPNCQGVAPSLRESHTATLVGGEKLVIFGGSGEGGANYLNDLHVLDLKSMQWTCPEVKGDIPVPRDSHSAVAIGRKLFVYGGDCGDRYQGDVDMLDMDTMTWARLGFQGPSPGVRAGHAAVSFGTKVYVIGGVGYNQYYNDVWVFDISFFPWTRLEICGEQPQGRFSHTAIVTDTDITIYGGCGEDERPLNELLILQLGAEHPNGRYNISMCKIFGSQCQEKRKFMQEAYHIQKTTILGANIVVVRNGARESEPEPKLPFLLSSDTLHPKRRRTANSKICERESEPEENSLSLSQNSSTSHSDQDQTPVNKAISSAKAAQLLTFIKQHSQVSSNIQSDNVNGNQSNPRTIISRAPQDLYALGEHLNQPKPEQNHHDVHKGRNEVHYSAAEQKSLGAGHFQNLGPEVFSRGAIFGQNHSSPASQISRPNSHSSRLNPTFLRHSQQPEPLHSPEPIQNFRQTHVSRPSLVIRPNLTVQSEVLGVVLTLGGPGNTGEL